jgi:hypothetical protein
MDTISIGTKPLIQCFVLLACQTVKHVEAHQPVRLAVLDFFGRFSIILEAVQHALEVVLPVLAHHNA